MTQRTYFIERIILSFLDQTASACGREGESPAPRADRVIAIEPGKKEADALSEDLRSGNPASAV